MFFILLDPSTKSLPSRTFCRTFFESYPSVHLWKSIYTDDEVLQTQNKSLSDALNVVCYYLSKEKYTTAFEALHKSVGLVSDESDESKELLEALSLQNELLGILYCYCIILIIC